MMAPPPASRMWGTTVCMPSQHPSWLTRNSSSTSSIGMSCTLPKRRMPALFARIVTKPKRSLVSLISDVHEAGSLTSWNAKWACSPNSSASACPSSLATSAITT